MKMRQIWRGVDVKGYIVRRKIDVSILFIGIFIGIFFGWGLAEVIFFSVFIWSIIGPIQSKWLALFAAIFLFSSPVLFLLDFDNQAEDK